MLGRWFRGGNLMDPWRDAFVVQLRLRDVPGRSIGDALAQVDAHCAESGESPLQAFGDAAEYADEMAPSLPHTARVPWWGSGVLAGSTMLGVVGFLDSASGLRDHSTATLGAGELVSAVMIGVLVAAWVGWLPWLMRGGRRWPTVIVLWIGLTVPVGLGALWRRPALTANAVVLLGVSLTLLAVGGVSFWLWNSLPGRSASRGAALIDPVIDPRTGREPFVLPRGSRWLMDLLPWMLPATLVVASVIVILV